METSAQSAQSNQCGFEFIQVVGTTGNQSVIDTDLFKPESIFARKPDGRVPVAIWFAGLRDSEICNIDSGDVALVWHWGRIATSRYDPFLVTPSFYALVVAP